MNYVLIDTGPLVGLCCTNDPHHKRTVRESNMIAESLLLCIPVMSETLFFLKHHAQRARLRAFVERGALSLYTPEQEIVVYEDTLRWLEKYEDHLPDFTDGYLMCLSKRANLPIWTFDREFRNTWKNLDGKFASLAPKS